MSICVVTDSSAVMPEPWLKALPLRIISLEIAWADGTTAPGDLRYADIADRLTSNAPPKTGAPSPEWLKVLLTDVLASYDGALVVCPPQDLSRTYASATIAAREIGTDRIRVLDAGTAAAGQGLVAAEAAKAAAGGGDLEAVCERALAVASRAQVWATLTQLDFLRRSGRMPALTAIGGALRLQPIVRYIGSSASPVGVTRSAKRATDRLFRAWEGSITDGSPLHAIVFHSARTPGAFDLLGRMQQRVPGGAIDAVEVTASLAAHTGPGLLGVAWFWDN